MKSINFRLYRCHGYASPTDYAHKCIVPYTQKMWNLYCDIRPADFMISRIADQSFLNIHRRLDFEMHSM